MSEEQAATVEETTTTEAEGSVETTESTTTEQKAFVDSMLEQITDDDVKSHKMWDNLKGKNADELARYVKELKSFAGKKGDIPKSDAPQEEWDEFYSKLGRPESKDGYEFTMNDEFRELVGDSAPFFEEVIEGFKEQSFALGLDAKKAEALVDWYLDKVATQTKEGNGVLEQVMSEKEAKLKEEWGGEYDGLYNGNKALLKRFGMSDEDLAMAESAGVLKEPALAVTLAKINAQFEDDPQIGHMQTRTVSGLKDQLSEVNEEVKQFIIRGEKVPEHIANKRMDLMNKLGDNL